MRWDYEEEEPNDNRSEAMPIEAGDRLYGSIESGTKNDWFSLEIAEANSNVVIEIELLGWFPTINDSFVKLRGYWLEREIRATADADR